MMKQDLTRWLKEAMDEAECWLNDASRPAIRIDFGQADPRKGNSWHDGNDLNCLGFLLLNNVASIYTEYCLRQFHWHGIWANQSPPRI
jgi:hypothetical protein